MTRRLRHLFTLLLAFTLLGSTAASPEPAIQPAAKASPSPAQSPAAPVSPAPSPSPSRQADEYDSLLGDWDGARPWLRENGITIKPRLTLFGQGLSSGEGAPVFDLSGKADLLIQAQLSKLGLWTGSSLTMHLEQNFGNSANGQGCTLVPVNVAQAFPGQDTFAVSSLYLTQTLGKSASLMVGKMNMVDLGSTRPFMGGAGVDAFWNTTFAAPPSGVVPPYLFGALLTVKTDPATVGFWVYDPASVVDKSPFDKPFSQGITFRGSINFPVTVGGLGGHQQLVALYSTEKGDDLATYPDVLIPPHNAVVGVKNGRCYFAYAFDQSLYQSKENPKEGVGIFGQFGISDGNPNILHYSGFFGLGGTGLIPGRRRDNWGVGYYSDALSPHLKRLLDLRNEQGLEAFYNFHVTNGLTVGADLQLIWPSMSNVTAVFPGVRTVLRF